MICLEARMPLNHNTRTSATQTVLCLGRYWTGHDLVERVNQNCQRKVVKSGCAHSEARVIFEYYLGVDYIDSTGDNIKIV